MLIAAYGALSSYPLTIAGAGNLSEKIFGQDLRYLLFAAWVAIVFVFVRLVDLIAFEILVPRRSRLRIPLLLRQMVSVGLYFFLFGLVISSVFERSLTGLLATTTVVAAVVGLALQDTLGNLFSGISLHMERTFEVGDVVRSGDLIGVVESVNWRSTRLRAFTDNVIVFPNSLIAKENLQVYSCKELNARIVRVGAPYDVPPARVIQVVQQAVGNVAHVSSEIPALVRIGDFGESSIDYDVKYWTRRYDLRDTIDADVRKAIWYAFARNDISIPFPIRTLHRYSPAPGAATIGREEIFSRLESVDILAPLAAEGLRELASTIRSWDFGAGETILHRGDEGSSMFVIHRGTVSIRTADRGEVAQLGAGSIFGEMALLTGESRMADVIAASDVTAFEIDKAALQPMLQRDPALAAALSARVTERMQRVSRIEGTSPVEAQTTLLGRIRSYFGL